MRKPIILIFTLLSSIFQISAQNNMKLSDKIIIKTKIFHQSIDSLWWRWTTHEGLKTFFGRDNKIELTPGGAFEIYFLTDNAYGQKGSEGCKVLSYLPGKMFSFSWNAPPQFPEVRNSEYKTWVVVQFNEISETQTEVTLTHFGWLKDEKWTPVYDYFSEAWGMVMNNLSQFEPKKIVVPPTFKKVTVLGGVFFKCKDPKKIREWYKMHLGLQTDQYGTNFVWYQGADSTKRGSTQWSPFKDSTQYFEPSKKDFMFNYRVSNLEALVKQLKMDGVTITDSIETYSYGKFVHIMDPEGNKIELWEPNDIEYDKFDGGRTK